MANEEVKVEQQPSAATEAPATSTEAKVETPTETPVVTEEPVVKTEEGKPAEAVETQKPDLAKKDRENIHLRKRAQTAEQEAAYWRGVAAAREQQPQTQQPTQVSSVDAPPALPDASKFEGGAFSDEYRAAELSYAADLGAWKVRQQQKADAEKAARATQEKTEQEREAALRAKMEAAEEEDPGISDILRDPNMPLSRPMYDAIRESDAAPKLFRYLSDNREEAKKIFYMTPAAAIRAVALIESKLTAPPVRPAVKVDIVSQAPAPMTTVRTATGSPPVDEEHESPESFYARRQREEFGPGGPRHHELIFRGRQV
jgi:hypothetical protein